MTKTLTIFCQKGCGFCVRSRQLVEGQGLELNYIDIQEQNITQADMEATIGKPIYSMPQIFHGTTYLGGYNELVEFLSDDANLKKCTPKST